MTTQKEQFILVYGNVADGLTFLGPYSDAEAAMAYAEAFLNGENWDVIKLNTPPTLEEFDEFDERETERVRVVIPKSGSQYPILQHWHAGDGEPLLRSDYRPVTSWLEI